MPLVLAESEVTAAGISYEDRTGVSYQYPSRYRRAIQPGERFVYYKGRRTLDGGRVGQIYFGAGVVGRCEADAKQPDRFTCEILDYRAFSAPVPFKDARGEYLESGAVRRGYFQPGVRAISDGDFARILAAAEVASDAQAGPAGSPRLADSNTRAEGSPRYASAEMTRAVEEFAVRVALEEVRRRFPKSVVDVQPRNNPGFDILIAEHGGSSGALGTEHFYVEVKGTTRTLPVFFASEGELQFSRRNRGRYRLIVVYKIQFEPAQHEVCWHEGAIADYNGFRLKPVQWACEVVHADGAAGTKSGRSAT